MKKTIAFIVKWLKKLRVPFAMIGTAILTYVLTRKEKPVSGVSASDAEALKTMKKREADALAAYNAKVKDAPKDEPVDVVVKDFHDRFGG
jgi:hypothetical protein